MSCPNCNMELAENGCEECEHTTDGRDCLCDYCNPKHRVYESMTRWCCYGYIIRVWSDQPKFTRGPDEEIFEKLSTWHGHSPGQMVEQLCEEFPRISAIEVLDASGNGGLYYPDWK